MKEEWKVILGAPDYEVSNKGRVRTIRTGLIRRPSVKRNGYLEYNLWVDKKYTYHLIHRLVAKHFLPAPIAERDMVAHLDHDRKNNVVTNLKWATATENNHDTNVAGRRHASTNPNRAHKLTAEKVARMREMAKAGFRTGLIAQEFDITTSQVRLIVRGKSWALPPTE